MPVRSWRKVEQLVLCASIGESELVIRSVGGRARNIHKRSRVGDAELSGGRGNASVYAFENGRGSRRQRKPLRIKWRREKHAFDGVHDVTGRQIARVRTGFYKNPSILSANRLNGDRSSVRAEILRIRRNREQDRLAVR